MQEFGIDNLQYLGYNLNMEYETECLIKKVNTIFKLGYLPKRGSQTYRYITIQGEAVKLLANCFEHACFNLLNNHFSDYDISYNEANAFWDFPSCFTKEQRKKNATSFKDFIKETGLTVSDCDIQTEITPTEWKVALFFNPYSGDFHFMREEKNKKWSSKLGESDHLQHFESLPEKFNDDYSLNQVFKISNSYLEK